MKRIKRDSKTEKTTSCEHKETYAVAAFVDDDAKEAFLLQVCDQCGENLLLMGQYPLTVC